MARKHPPLVFGELGPDGCVELGVVETLAAVQANTWDAKTRTFEALLYSGASVLRRGWSGNWMLQFSMEPGALRTQRLDQGLPILLDHGWSSLTDSQVGITKGYRFEGQGAARQLVVAVQLSARDEVAPIAQDVADGVKKFLSMGAQPWKSRVTPADPEAQPPRLEHVLAIDWEVLEGSLVAVPADHKAQVLAADGRPAGRLEGGRHGTNRVHVVIESPPDTTAQLSTRGTEEGTRVLTAEETAQKLAAEALAKKQADDAAELATKTKQADAAGAARERSRVALVRQLCASHKLDRAFEDELLAAADATEDQVRERVLAKLAARPSNTTPQPVAQLGEEPADHAKKGLVQALELRTGIVPDKVDERANRFRGVTTQRMFEEYLRATGQLKSADGFDVETVGRLAFGMVGTSDLPKILENIAQKNLQRGYDTIPTTWQLLAGPPVDGVDFKDRSTVHNGLGSKLQKVLEGGEIPMGKMAEGGEKYHVETWGIIKPYTMRALRNDDTGAIGREPFNLGVQAAMTVDEELWKLITGNAVMADGVALFNAAHNNLAASTKNYTLLGSNAELGLGELERVLRQQLDDDGLTILGLPGSFLIVPSTLAVQARKLTALISQPTQTSGVNVFDFLKPVINPRLDTTSGIVYYMATNPSIVPVFETCFLDGRRVPIIDSKEGFEQDGLLIRCRWYWGGVIPNHRGIAKSTGADA